MATLDHQHNKFSLELSEYNYQKKGDSIDCPAFAIMRTGSRTRLSTRIHLTIS